jgi:hypothetical protein
MKGKASGGVYQAVLYKDGFRLMYGYASYVTHEVDKVFFPLKRNNQF